MEEPKDSAIEEMCKATTSEICDVIADNVRTLTELWRDLGIDEAAMLSRLERTRRKIVNLFTAMRDDQEELKERILRHISSYKSEVERLASELAIPVTLPQASTLVQQEDEMLALVQRLREIRSSRKREFRRLKSQEAELCHKLQEPFPLKDTGTVPTHEELQELREHVHALVYQKAQRTCKFLALQREIAFQLNLVGAEPDMQFEREIVDSPETVILSLQNLENAATYLQKLKELGNSRHEEIASLMEKLNWDWERLGVPEEQQLRRPTGLTQETIDTLKQEASRLNDMKRQRLREMVEKTHDELIAWSMKCCVPQVLEEQHDQHDVSEAHLENIEQEVRMYKYIYYENRTIFTKVERREVLWAKYLELEKKSNDPSRFNNRGGQLPFEIREHSRLQAELQRLEQEIRCYIRNYRGNKQEIFNRWGEKFLDHITAQNEALEKEQERLERLEPVATSYRL